MNAADKHQTGTAWASAGRPFSFETKTLGEKVGYPAELDYMLLRM